MVEKRKRVLNEWLAWTRREKQLVLEEKDAYGVPPEADEPRLAADAPVSGAAQGDTVVEELVEEIVEESEVIV